MTRIPALDPATATGKQKTLLDAVQKKFGRVPNLMRTLAQSPAALDGYLALNSALAAGGLDAKTREQIALTVAEANLCDYCLSAHTAIGGMVGLSTSQVTAARQASADTPRTNAILKLARSIVVNRGNIADADLAAARAAGVGDAEIVETTVHVALNILTNYVNHVADTAIDFPPVAKASPEGECAAGACSTR